VLDVAGKNEGAGGTDALARARRAEDELERFFAVSIDMLCVASFDGYFTRVNPSFERVLGYTTEELLQEPFLGFVHPDDRAATEAELSAGAGGATTVSYENRYRCRDGSYRWLQWTSVADASRGALYAVARDVTESKLAEAALQTLLAGQAALRRVATLVAREGEHHDVFDLVTEEVAHLLAAPSSSIVRFDGERHGVVMGGWSKGDAPRLPPGSPIELESETASGRVYRTGGAVRVHDLDGPEGTLARALNTLGFRSAVGAPIVVDGRPWGALIASSTSEEPWPEGAEKQLADFAELVAQALANADAREQLAASRARIVEASDAERRRLERNLHDGAQQRLVALSLDLRLARSRLESAPADAGRLIDGASRELALALSELRELAHGLHPALLADRGLGPALEAVAARAPVPVEIAELPEERLPEPVEVAAYYLVSEALTNVAKYAQATSAAIAIARTGERAIVEVSDDGVGGAEARPGSGLRGLGDRIAALQGTLSIDSPPGGGTRIRAEIPYGCSGSSDQPSPPHR